MRQAGFCDADMSRPPKVLIAFCERLDQEPEMAALVRAAPSAEHVLAIAVAAGYPLSLHILSSWSLSLTASYFPWSGRGRAWRLQFFANPVGQRADA